MERLLVLNYIKKIFIVVDAIFKVVKLNFGSKFEAWVSFHTAILQS